VDLGDFTFSVESVISTRFTHKSYIQIAERRRLWFQAATPPPLPNQQHFTILWCTNLLLVLLFYHVNNSTAEHNACACVDCDFWEDALRIATWSGSALVRWAAGALHCAAIIHVARWLRKILRKVSPVYSESSSELTFSALNVSPIVTVYNKSSSEEFFWEFWPDGKWSRNILFYQHPKMSKMHSWVKCTLVTAPW